MAKSEGQLDLDPLAWWLWLPKCLSLAGEPRDGTPVAHTRSREQVRQKQA